MKIRYSLLVLLAAALWSCVEDKSDKGGRMISRIEFQEEFSEEIYQSDRFEDFYLKSPAIEQTGQEKPVEYRWEVDYKVVSTEKDLVFNCPDLTPSGKDAFNCRLIVTNEDGASWLDFKLRVKSALEVGVLVMSELNDDTYFSFRREDTKLGADGKPVEWRFIEDIYNSVNPDYPLGRKPANMLRSPEWTGAFSLYLATTNPSRIMKVNDKTLVATKMLVYPLDEFDGFLPFLGAPSPFHFLAGGRLVSLDTWGDGFQNGGSSGQQAIENLFADDGKPVVISKGITMIAAAWTNLNLLYESVRGVLLMNATIVGKKVMDDDGQEVKDEYGKTVFEPYPEFDFSGSKRFVNMGVCRGGKDALVAVADGSALTLHKVSAYSGTPPYVVLENSLDATGTGIDETTVFLGFNTKYQCYYTVGNKVYFINYMAGELEPVEVATVGSEGDVIKFMRLRRDEGRVYVAYEKPSGEKIGCVAAYDISNNDRTWTLAWKEEGIAGRITDMIYKY